MPAADGGLHLGRVLVPPSRHRKASVGEGEGARDARRGRDSRTARREVQGARGCRGPAAWRAQTIIQYVSTSGVPCYVKALTLPRLDPRACRQPALPGPSGPSSTRQG